MEAKVKLENAVSIGKHSTNPEDVSDCVDETSFVVKEEIITDSVIDPTTAYERIEMMDENATEEKYYLPQDISVKLEDYTSHDSIVPDHTQESRHDKSKPSDLLDHNEDIKPFTFIDVGNFSYDGVSTKNNVVKQELSVKTEESVNQDLSDARQLTDEVELGERNTEASSHFECLKFGKVCFSEKSQHQHIENEPDRSQDSKVTDVVPDETTECTFRCNICSESFQRKSKLYAHLSSHSSVDPYNCPKCSKSFSQPWFLDRHLLTHSGVRLFNCGQCKKQFVQKAHLERHLLKHSRYNKSFKCSQCRRTFGQKAHLDRHVHTHTGNTPFACNQCNKSFCHKSYLESHLQSHSDTKPYSCNQCQKSFRYERSLNSHLNLHFGIFTTRFHCGHCEKTFSKQSNLNRHIIMTHSG